LGHLLQAPDYDKLAPEVRFFAEQAYRHQGIRPPETDCNNQVARLYHLNEGKRQEEFAATVASREWCS
jgi:hypothetical protein